LQSVIDYCLQTPPRLLLIIVVATGCTQLVLRTLTTKKSIIQHLFSSVYLGNIFLVISNNWVFCGAKMLLTAGLFGLPRVR
jgi:hypothetical protein